MPAGTRPSLRPLGLKRGTRRSKARVVQAARMRRHVCESSCVSQIRYRRVGKGALAPCPPSLSVAKDTWARFALPTLRHGSSHTFGVIARLDRAIQSSERAVVERRSRGVLDSPPSRGMTALLGERAIASYSVIARSPCDEAIQNRHRGKTLDCFRLQGFGGQVAALAMTMRRRQASRVE